MKKLFVVVRSHGEPWQRSKRLEEQSAWMEHAAYMDALVAEGFVVLGGPLVGGDEALLIVRAEGRDEIERRMAEDPWTPLGMLYTSRIAEWELRLGELGVPAD